MDERLVSHEIHLKQRPVGMPTENDFQLVKVDVPELKNGEFLVPNIWMSVDPYMRGRMREIRSYISPFQIGKPLEGGCVGQIVKSINDQFKVGDYVLGNLGWREYWLSDGNKSDMIKIDPNLAPIQWYLGILGLTGLTAYVGLLKIAQLVYNSKGGGNVSRNQDRICFCLACTGGSGSKGGRDLSRILRLRELKQKPILVPVFVAAYTKHEIPATAINQTPLAFAKRRDRVMFTVLCKITTSLFDVIALRFKLNEIKEFP